MVSVEVQGQMFDLETKDVIGSKTIENLIQYYTGGIVSVHIGVNLDDWYEYVDFLDYSNPTFAALKVIDYLDNVLQARIWCVLKYRLLRKQYGIRDDNIVTNTLITIINDNTQFIPEQVLPFDLLLDFDSILHRVKDINNNKLSVEHISHIVNTLYSPYIAGIYYNLIRLKSIGDMSVKYIDGIESLKFILQIDNDTFRVIDDEVILYQDDIGYYNSDYKSFSLHLLHDATFISPRIAAYYYGIKTYDVRTKNLVYCPNDKPCLKSWTGREIDEQSNTIYASCDVDNIVNNHINIRQPINVYQPNSKYIPYAGFQTNIDIKSRNGDYKLLTYNSPSMYDRDYFIFLPYEYDPIAKVVYAFCV